MATGQTLDTFLAVDGVPASTNGALQKLVNNRTVLQFDPTTQQSADFAFIMPRNYGSGGVTITLIWEGDTATTGNVLWSAAFERNASGGNAITSDSFATAVNAGGGAAAVNGSLGKLSYTTIALTDGTQMNSIAVGELGRIRIARVAADGTDTMAGLANLVAFELKET